MMSKRFVETDPKKFVKITPPRVSANTGNPQAKPTQRNSPSNFQRPKR